MLNKGFISGVWAVFLFLFLLMICGCAKENNIESVYYSKLDNVRDRKHRQLDEYLSYVQSAAGSIKDDQVMKDLFAGKNKIFQQYKNSPPPESVQYSLFQLRDAIEDRYIEKYLVFSDILFISPEGDIFYTVRRQRDYRKNIFGKELSDTSLAHHLRDNPTKTFVDFQNYKISGDPAAFFVEPNMEGSKMVGWFVLQFSINKINDMFSVEESLGSTGEVFLVNKDCYMLTDSRFFADSTILKKHLSEQNINAKFSERSGRKLVTDYRGYRAITSFEVISLLGSEWLLIAKIDEDEIVSEDYKKKKKDVFPKLIDQVKKYSAEYSPTDQEILMGEEVSVDEYKRAANGEILYTHGVSTCTAFVISQKGKFAYLAHISAYDWLYGAAQTDIARRMLARIDKFDIVQNDKREIQVLLISPELPDTEKLVDALLDWGIFISQIKMVSNPAARYANVSHDYITATTAAEWKIKDSASPKIKTSLAENKTLADLFKTLRS